MIGKYKRTLFTKKLLFKKDQALRASGKNICRLAVDMLPLVTFRYRITIPFLLFYLNGRPLEIYIFYFFNKIVLLLSFYLNIFANTLEILKTYFNHKNKL
mgnify:CR=1 FL=1